MFSKHLPNGKSDKLLLEREVRSSNRANQISLTLQAIRHCC